MRPATPVLDVEALQATAQSYVGQRYAWWQILWFLLTGWFVRTDTPSVICSALVPKALEAGKTRVWHSLDGLDTRRQYWMRSGWATPGDLYEHGNFKTLLERRIEDYHDAA